MLDKSIVERVLLKAAERGGDFSEVFLEKARLSRLVMGAGKMDALTSSLRLGAGIRVFKDDFCGYAYTNDLSEAGLMKAAAAASAVIDGKKLISKISLVNQETDNAHSFKIDPQSVSKTDKVALMRKYSDLGYAASSKVCRTDVYLFDKMQDVLIANSEGLWVEDSRVRSRFGFEVQTADNGKNFQTLWVKGMLQGFEMYDEIDADKNINETVRQAVDMLLAENCPAGKMPVVLKSGIGGTLFHEACGHSLEATALARKASTFCDKLGQQIASPLLTLIDDGTLPNHWGSTNVDDEGIKTQRNLLIENGILKGYLVDRFNGRRLKMRPTGSSRRSSYEFAPTSRMNNTFISAGNSTPQEVIANTENGIYVAQIKGGSVNTATGDFNFSVSLAYLIENGKITKPVKGAKLIGNGADILKNVDMLGNDLIIHGGGNCGSISGWVPVCHGTPTLRVSEMTVGGQK